MPTASAAQPASTNGRSRERERHTDRTATVSSSQKAANIAIPEPMIRYGCSVVASSAASGVSP